MKVSHVMLFMAALFTGAAHAENIGYQQNQAGGSIVLTNIKGKCPGDAHFAYSTTANGQNLQTGCWGYIEPTVFIRWGDGAMASYDVNNFTPTEWTRRHSKGY